MTLLVAWTVLLSAGESADRSGSVWAGALVASTETRWVAQTDVVMVEMSVGLTVETLVAMKVGEKVASMDFSLVGVKAASSADEMAGKMDVDLASTMVVPKESEMVSMKVEQMAILTAAL